MALNPDFWIAEGFRGIFTHRFTSTVTIIGISLSLGIFGFLYLLWENIQQYRQDLLSSFEIEVFIDPSVPESEHSNIGELIKELDGINNVEYVSKEEAAEIFARDFGEELFEILEENPLPASFKASIAPDYRTSVRTQALIERINGIQGVDESVFHGSLLEKLNFSFNTFARVLIFIGLILLSVAMAVFFQGIGLSIRARQSFINSLLLTGARFGAIRLPFIMEGFFIGLISGVIAYAALLSVSLVIDRFFINFVFIKQVYIFIPLGTLLGFLGSLLSTNKNLKGYLTF